jgi:membrane protein DedA with SNARE-associated domain
MIKTGGVKSKNVFGDAVFAGSACPNRYTGAVTDIGSQIMELLLAGQSTAGLGALFGSAMIEYVFPPFPGDTITLFGAFLAAHQGWNIPAVFLAVTLGSVAGSAIDYMIGRRLVATPLEDLSPGRLKVRDAAGPLLVRFEKHGVMCILLNRFLPGIRALFFLAAGMAGLPMGKVLALGAVSAAIWNALIIVAGIAIGKNWERLLGLLQTYTVVAWVVVGIVVAGLIVHRLTRHS